MIEGIPNRINTSTALPPDVNTLGDLFTKRVKLPMDVDRCSEDNDSIADILRLNVSPEDIFDEKIRTQEDIVLSLFTLATHGKVFTNDGEESSSIEQTFGTDIGAARCNHGFTLITRSSSFSHSGIPVPKESVENILYVDTSDLYDVYLLTTSTLDDIRLAPIEGLPNDEHHVVVNARLLDRISLALGIDDPVKSFENIRIESDGVVRILSESLDLYGVVSPLMKDDIDSPRDKKSYHDLTPLTGSFH